MQADARRAIAEGFIHRYTLAKRQAERRFAHLRDEAAGAGGTSADPAPAADRMARDLSAAIAAYDDAINGWRQELRLISISEAASEPVAPTTPQVDDCGR